MLECTVKRTHKFWLAFFLVALVAQGGFGIATPVLADDLQWERDNDPSVPPAPAIDAATTTKTGSTDTKAPIQDDAGPPASNLGLFETIGTGAMNGLTQLFSWFAGGAAGLFVWVVHPDNMSGPTGILNKGSIYELWKFIRDFFNLFFILILLLSAFATVFQVDNFSIRKIFLNVLIAALIINFSFPITRLLIDLANVPMYYFFNAILPGTAGGSAFTSSFLSSTGMGGLAVVPATNFVSATMSAIFMFLFMISLMVLGVLFLIRLIALTLLLVFSPFGFAATLMPGFQSLGRDWWNYFWKYAFFGPAAALMLLVAIRFQQELGADGTFNQMRGVITDMSAGPAESSMIARIVFYTIPLILIWSAIGMANKFSIAGAGIVTGMGYGAARKVGGWAKRGAVGGAKFVGRTAVAPVAPLARGAKEGVQSSLKSGKWFGRDLNKVPGGKFLTGKYYKKTGENREAAMKGMVTGGSKGRQSELDKLQLKRQYEAAEEMKKNNDSDSSLRDSLKGGDKDKAAAAAMVLTDRKAIKTADDFEKALDALGNNTKEIAELIEKSGDSVMDSMSVDQYKKVAAVEAAAVRSGHNPEIQKQLNARLVKEGGSKTLVDYEIDVATSGAPATATAVQMEAAVRKVLTPMKSARDVAKQDSLFNDPSYSGFAQFVISSRTNDQIQQIKKASAEDGTSVGSFFP